MDKAKKSFKEPSNTPGGVLAKLWQNIIRDNGLQPKIFPLIDRYLSRNVEVDNKSNIRKTKATLIANLTSSDMTWKTFTMIMFEYLGARKIDITIKITPANGIESLHNVTVLNSHLEKDKEETDVK